MNFTPRRFSLPWSLMDSKFLCTELLTSLRCYLCLAGLSFLFAACASDRLWMHISDRNMPGLEAELRNGGKPNEAKDSGLTPLMTAAAVGDVSAIEILLKYQADPNLHLFIKEFSYVRKTWQHGTCLKIHGDIGHMGSGLTALHAAAMQGHEAAVDRLIMGGALPNAVTADCSTALMLAADCIRNELCKNPEKVLAIRKIVALLAGKGNVNMKNKAGWTALMSAASSGDTAIVKTIMKAGAIVDVQNNVGLTALMIAAHSNHVEVAGILLDAGAKPDVSDNLGMTALFAAAEANARDTVRLLLKRGANREHRNKAGMTVLEFLNSRRQSEMHQFISQI